MCDVLCNNDNAVDSDNIEWINNLFVVMKSWHLGYLWKPCLRAEYIKGEALIPNRLAGDCTECRIRSEWDVFRQNGTTKLSAKVAQIV